MKMTIGTRSEVMVELQRCMKSSMGSGNG